MEDNKAVDRQGIDFSVDEEPTEPKESDKKKPKKGFQKLLSKLLPQEPETVPDAESKEGDDKSQRFRRIFQNLFGSVVDFKESPTDDLHESHVQPELSDNEQPRAHEFGFPLINHDVATEYVEPSRVADSEIYVPSETIANEENNTEREEPELRTDESIVRDQVDNRNAVINQAIRTESEQRIAEPDIQRELMNQPEAVSPVKQEIDNSVENNTYIEQNGGGGAALLGFVAAETLSRHRDKKIRKEARQLREQVKKIDSKHQNEELNISTAVAQNREQIAYLRQRREMAEQKPLVRSTPEVTKTNVSYEADRRVAEKVIEKHNVYTRESRPVYEQRDSREVVQTSKETVEKSRSPSENLILEQVEKAAEHDVALEAYYERMHEAKDVPTNSGTAGGSAGGYVQQDQHSGHNDRAQDQAIRKLQEEHRAVKESRDLYQNAAKRGVWAGIAVLIAFMLIALLWSLL